MCESSELQREVNEAADLAGGLESCQSVSCSFSFRGKGRGHQTCGGQLMVVFGYFDV